QAPFEGVFVMKEISTIVVRLGLDEDAAPAAFPVEKEIQGRREWEISGKLQAHREDFWRRLLALEAEMRSDTRLAAVRADDEARVDLPHCAVHENVQRVSPASMKGLERCPAPDLGPRLGRGARQHILHVGVKEREHAGFTGRRRREMARRRRFAGREKMLG